jgi:hypothetical protein
MISMFWLQPEGQRDRELSERAAQQKRLEGCKMKSSIPLDFRDQADGLTIAE